MPLFEGGADKNEQRHVSTNRKQPESLNGVQPGVREAPKLAPILFSVFLHVVVRAFRAVLWCT